MIRRSTILCAAFILTGCATATRSEAFKPVQLVHGEQIRLWGVDVRRDMQDIKVSGQVQRSALPRGPLKEHVHFEVLDGEGALLATQDASIYPVVNLRAQGTARLTASVPEASLNENVALQLRVVAGAPHD